MANRATRGRAKISKRKSGGGRGYGARWRRLSKAWLSREPENGVCARCRQAGRTAAADVVDHVVPHRGDQRLFWEESNWQGLCKPCHDAKTGEGR